MLGDGLYTLLTSDPTLSSLTGGRVFPVFRPEEAAFPCLTFQVVTGSTEYAFDMSVETESVVQFDAWGNTYGQVKTIQQALIHLLDSYVGTLSNGTVIQGAFRGEEHDDFNEDARVHRALTEYRIRYVE